LSTISVSNAAAAGKVISASVKAFKKQPGKDLYVFTLEVVREKATYGLQKTFDEFFDFHTAIIFQFPEEAGRRSQRRTLPDLPLQTVFVSESIAAQRRMELDRYIKKIFQLPEKISNSTYVLKFLEPKEGGGSAHHTGGAHPPSAAPGFRASANLHPTNGAAPVSYKDRALPKPKPLAPAPRAAPPRIPDSKNPGIRASIRS